MRARRFHYGSAIVRQGDPLKNITIICRGEALLKIDPNKLSQQYKLDGERRPLTVIQKRREILKRGYVAAEEILKQKNVTVATLGTCELIGDVEFVLGRSRHHITAVANTEMLVMEMELTELQRLTVKRDGGVSDLLHHIVLCKLGSRAERCTNGISDTNLNQFNNTTLYKSFAQLTNYNVVYKIVITRLLKNAVIVFVIAPQILMLLVCWSIIKLRLWW